MTLAQTPDFPDAFKGCFEAQRSLDFLRTCDDVRWTYVARSRLPGGGRAHGGYKLAGEELALNSRGESTISYADYAIAMVDEAQSGDHVRQRISVVSK